MAEKIWNNRICVCSVRKMRLFLPQGQFSQKARWAVSKDGGSHHVVVRPPPSGSARGHSAPGRPDPALQPQGGLALTPAGPSQANTRTQDPHTARTCTHTHTHTSPLWSEATLQFSDFYPLLIPVHATFWYIWKIPFSLPFLPPQGGLRLHRKLALKYYTWSSPTYLDAPSPPTILSNPRFSCLDPKVPVCSALLACFSPLVQLPHVF